MDGRTWGDAVRVGGDARQRFHDSRGYGRALEGDEIALSRVEAAHLLFRNDLDAVDGDGFAAFFARTVASERGFVPRFLVYADLRERGFYLSPAVEGWPGAADTHDDARGDSLVDADFAVYERGSGPGGAVAYRVRVVGERGSIPAASLLPDSAADVSDDATAGADRALAVVDEESEITYFDLAPPGFAGATRYDPPASLTGSLLDDRVLCWDAPEAVYERGFYGRPLTGRNADGDAGPTALQLSLVEAASLAADGHLRLASPSDADAALADRGDGDRPLDGDDARAAVGERGRAVEGERFDRRLRVYRDLRAAGVVPKTGYKFGADFRTYDEVTTVSELSHSERLVRVLLPDHAFDPRDLSLDVRLASGVRKRMVFALTDVNGETDWLSVGRLTP